MSLLKTLTTLTGVLFLSFTIMAQSVDEAGAKYNEGNEFYKEKNFASAVKSYEEALKIAKSAGPDAADLKSNIEKQLLNSYYNSAKNQYKKAKYDAAIATFEKTYAFANEIGDNSKAKASKSYIARVRTSKGTSLLKDNNTDDAFSEFKMATEISPKYYKAYFGLMLVYKDQDDMANMMANADKVLELGASDTKASKTVKKTKSTASKALLNAGAKEIQSGSSKKAIEYINDSFKYADGSSMSYYYLALAYNKENNWAEAISSCEKAISMDPEKDKSDIYFTMGQAYEGNGDSAKACESYKKVSTGPNVDAAKYQITQVLKCG